MISGAQLLIMKTRKTVALQYKKQNKLASSLKLPSSFKIFIVDFKSNEFSSLKNKTFLSPYRVLEVLETPRKPFPA